ncbi:MAG: ATP-dependent RNA helicase HrpA, partial [Smithellaceae bacterium]|nr:ATP-dependent RNA helicase HrpA [Smithellaceae bacterium]
MINYPANLPIIARREAIIETIASHPVTIVIGEAGSGKTTQLPKMCLELQGNRRGLIGCTQPRRLAAMMAARRIASELGEEVGQRVGYKIRFDDRTGRNQLIKIMTDGILLMEAQRDPLLRKYDTIIIDEAHERSLNIDFLLGIIRKIVDKRRQLKVIITSATIDALKFSQFFDQAPIIEVSGRMYPVETLYRPSDPREEEDLTHVEMAARTVNEIVDFFPPGDILIFMPTEADIRETCALLGGRYDRDTLILPLFARLSRAEQERVFASGDQRKIVVATNIAETSLTIPGIRYVLDSGLGRINEYNPRTKTVSLPIRPISASSADQRKGRCGRVQDGVCFRLYAEEDYHKLPIFTPPELLRSNLAEVILRMLYLELGDPSTFPFLDPPPLRNIQDGIDTLLELGAAVYADQPANGTVQDRLPNGKRPPLSLTPEGLLMARLPLDPRLSRMIIEAKREKCLREVLIIAAALTIQDPREIPMEQAERAAEVQSPFLDQDSDFLSLLKIYHQYAGRMEASASKGSLKKFCRDHFLSYRRMKEWRDIVEQLESILGDDGIKVEKTSLTGAVLYEMIHKSVISGYLSQIGLKKKNNLYQGAKGKEVHIFPGSGLYNKGSRWIIAPELIETSRLYARRLARIESAWLEELGKDLCRRTYRNPRWDSRRKEVVADLQVSLWGLVIVPQRTVSYGPVDPDGASAIFIREVLLVTEPEEDLALAFLSHNLDLQSRIRSWEDKLRRRNILVGEDAIIKFYHKRIPQIYNLKGLQRLIRLRGGDDFLRMEENDLLQTAPGVESALYPDQILIDSQPVPVSYIFAHGDPTDGVTLRVPMRLVARLPEALPPAIIPSLWREKLWQLLKGLPKDWRKRLHPLKETYQFILREFPSSQGPVHSELSRFLRDRMGVEIPVSAWPTERLEEHLNLRIALMGEDGAEHFASRDMARIKTEFSTRNENPAFLLARKSFERDHLVTWDFPDLPNQLPLEMEGVLTGYAFPALLATNQGVSLRLFMNPQEAESSHPVGVSALYQLHLADHFIRMRKHLALRKEIKLWAKSWHDSETLPAVLQKQVAKELLLVNIRRAEDFFHHGNEMKSLILPK